MFRLRRIIWTAFAILGLLLSEAFCGRADAIITNIIAPNNPEFQFEGGSSVSTTTTLSHSWVQIRFGEPGIWARDFVVDSAGILTITEDGTVAPPKTFLCKGRQALSI